jgi:predicted N-formylglutamate amidohydrolase
MPDYQSHYVVGQNRSSSAVVICDHATNTVPGFVNDGNLGLSDTDMARHIAYDVGALGVSKKLAELLNAPLVHSNFSRLVIDPNRGEDDPTLVMQLYDGSIIPANRNISQTDINLRMEKCYRPYHAALETVLSERENPVILSIHTFTKQLNGYVERPWHVGVLSSDDKRLSNPLLSELTTHTDLRIGDNQPYSGHLKGDTMEAHALRHGRIHALIEIRNDLIETTDNQHQWAEKLAPICASAIETARKKEA